MKPYLDSEDSYYFSYEELTKASKIITNLAELKTELEPKQKPKTDYAGIGAIIFTFTVISIVIGLTIFTAWQIVYGQENEVIVTIVKGSADAGSGENKYDGEKHAGYGFDPPELSIEKGTILKWINNDTSIHTVTSGKPSSNTVGTAFDSSYLNTGEPYLHKFNKKGTYDYFCTMYPFMKGKIIVK